MYPRTKHMTAVDMMWVLRNKGAPHVSLALDQFMYVATKMIWRFCHQDWFIKFPCRFLSSMTQPSIMQRGKIWLKCQMGAGFHRHWHRALGIGRDWKIFQRVEFSSGLKRFSFAEMCGRKTRILDNHYVRCWQRVSKWIQNEKKEYKWLSIAYSLKYNHDFCEFPFYQPLILKLIWFHLVTFNVDEFSFSFQPQKILSSFERIS